MLLLLLFACADRPLPATGTISEETFHSEQLDDDYVLRLRLPPGGATGPLPLVVQLDPTYANLHEFDRTVGFVSQHAADGDWPEAVVLGVDYPDPWTRHRDYTPDDTPDPAFQDAGADTFYAVLRDEILPHVEATLEVDRRVLVGHSNGGVFSAYAALRYDPAAPRLFDGFVSADFGIDPPMFTYLDWLIARTTDLPIRWYGTHAEFNGAPQAITHDAFWGRLREAGMTGLALRTVLLETDHGGAVSPSFEDGLAYTLAEVE